jgi:hypothetical protein
MRQVTMPRCLKLLSGALAIAALSCAMAGLCVGDAAAQVPLQGYGDFKFGMSLDEVLARPGISWPQPEKKKLADFIRGGATVYMMESLTPVRFGDLRAKVNLWFDESRNLTDGWLVEEKKMSFAECERWFQEELRKHETRYGEFSPGAEKKSPYRPLNTFERKVDWQSMPGARSVYSVVTQSETEKTNIFLQAKRSFRPGGLSIKFLHQSPQNRCQLELYFGDKDA